MFLIVTYIAGAFCAAVCSKDRGARQSSWILAGSCALLCAAYLTGDQIPLSGFSISTLWRGSASLPPGSAVSTNEAIAQTAFASPMATWLAGWLAGYRAVLIPLGARIAAVACLAGALVILARPRCGLYFILFFTLVGDVVVLPWYPFVKGFSARESLLFVHDALIASPLELYIVLTGVSWAGWQARQGRLRVVTGPLFWPTVAFLAFLLFGLAHGIGTGGNVRVALWEARAVFYLVALMILTSQLVDTPVRASRLMWAAMAALLIKGVYLSFYYLVVLNGNLGGMNGIGDHPAAIQLNTLLVMSLAAWIYHASPAKRLLVPLLVPVVIVGYIAMQRRAAFVTCAVALVLMAILLYQTRRRLFAVTLAAVAVGYVAVFWDNQSFAALPAQGIRSAIVARQTRDRDELSNDYRSLENRNISHTIHQHPWAGVGFGQKFSIVAAMPDISWFEWWEYIPHNSILWIWLKTGLGGFFSMLFLIGLTVVTGVRALQRGRDDDMSAIVLTATLYIVMYFIYACVDISWTAQSTVYAGIMMGLVNVADRMCVRQQELEQPSL